LLSQNSRPVSLSGHGTWVPDEDDDEVDGRDEALCPHDITQGEILTDDERYDIFSERNRRARIMMISDSCHSGTVSKACNLMPGTESDSWNFQKIRLPAPEFHMSGDDVLLRRARRVEKLRPQEKSGLHLFCLRVARMRNTAMTPGSMAGQMEPSPTWH
jgi:hypothetical protein